jgi:hypothetical protein
MAMTGSRFTIERQKLCLWLETEKRKLELLPGDLKRSRDQELEREFRQRLDRLYSEVQGRPQPREKEAKAKLN